MLQGVFYFFSLLLSLALQSSAYSDVTIKPRQGWIAIERDNGYRWNGALKPGGKDEKVCYDNGAFCIQLYDWDVFDCNGNGGAHRDYSIYVDGKSNSFRCASTQPKGTCVRCPCDIGFNFDCRGQSPV